jgi:hypothetical protein
VTTFGVGLTAMLKVSAAPAQVLAVGVTVIVALNCADVVFVAVNAVMLPVPVGARPIAASLFVHE